MLFPVFCCSGKKYLPSISQTLSGYKLGQFLILQEKSNKCNSISNAFTFDEGPSLEMLDLAFRIYRQYTNLLYFNLYFNTCLRNTSFNSICLCKQSWSQIVTFPLFWFVAFAAHFLYRKPCDKEKCNVSCHWVLLEYYCILYLHIKNVVFAPNPVTFELVPTPLKLYNAFFSCLIIPYNSCTGSKQHGVVT